MVFNEAISSTSVCWRALEQGCVYSGYCSFVFFFWKNLFRESFRKLNVGPWKTLMRPQCITGTFWNFIMPSQGSRLQWVILSISNSYLSDFKGDWWRDWTAQSGSRKDLCDSSLWIFNEAAELVRTIQSIYKTTSYCYHVNGLTTTDSISIRLPKPPIADIQYVTF